MQLSGYSSTEINQRGTAQGLRSRQQTLPTSLSGNAAEPFSYFIHRFTFTWGGPTFSKQQNFKYSLDKEPSQMTSLGCMNQNSSSEPPSPPPLPEPGQRNWNSNALQVPTAASTGGTEEQKTRSRGRTLDK